MRSFLLCGLLLGSSFSALACGGANPPAQSPAEASPVAPAHSPAAASSVAPAHSPAAASSEVKAPGEAKVGDKTRCPGSGEEFVVAADSPRVEHEGKTYYFCCPSCAKKFQADPKKFMTKPAS